ncbi:hypothetical protein COPEUT_02377 [Coprococcus eutactus ATCC 27759]|nr:hypothetical protein COPEUT_02377 [Coprococcus eutactus ATCC 27759]
MTHLLYPLINANATINSQKMKQTNAHEQTNEHVI